MHRWGPAAIHLDHTSIDRAKVVRRHDRAFSGCHGGKRLASLARRECLHIDRSAEALPQSFG